MASRVPDSPLCACRWKHWRGERLVRVLAPHVPPDTPGAPRRAKIAAMLGLGTRSTGPAECLAHSLPGGEGGSAKEGRVRFSVTYHGEG